MFFHRLRQCVLRRRSVVIDFRTTRRMSAAGTLLLAAELSRINEILGAERFITCSYPRDRKVAQVLQHVGVFELLGQTRRCRITADDVKYWKVDSGSLVDGEKADKAMEGYKHLFSDPKRKALYRGLTEAMTNCKQHAYEEDRGDGLGPVPRWWMFSELRKGRLAVAICDLGIGMPRSLRRDDAGLLGMILNVFSTRRLAPHDGNFISAAMEVGKSRTGEQHRGKGLTDLRAVLDGLGGKLQIHSNQGFCEYEANKSGELCKNFKASMSIYGTLVLWLTPVPGEEAE